LFSYTSVHETDGHNIKTTLSWSWDSSISLFGKQFISLFLVSLLGLLVILLPLNLCLIFTKTSYRIKFVCDYLKPYLDAFQAPFKNNHYFYFGLELLARPVSFAIGNTLLDPYKTLTFYGFIVTTFIVYLGVSKPFKSKTTLALHMSYELNLGCLALLALYYNTVTTSTSYFIIFNTLLSIALLEFGCTVLYIWYKRHLYKIEMVSVAVEKIAFLIRAFQRRYQSKSKEDALAIRPVKSFEQLREELLISDTEF